MNLYKVKGENYLPFFLYNLRNKISPGIIPVERRCAMVLNAQEKLKEKVLEKIIAQEQFSDGFKSLRKFFVESQENCAIKEFVSSSLISDFKNLKKTRSKNGTKNVPFIEKTKELIDYDISDFMIYILTEKGPNENVVSEYLISNHLQRVRDCRGSHHDAEIKNSQIVFDYVKKRSS